MAHDKQITTIFVPLNLFGGFFISKTRPHQNFKVLAQNIP